MYWSLISKKLSYIAAGAYNDVWGINDSNEIVKLDLSIPIPPDADDPDNVSEVRWVVQTALPNDDTPRMLDVGSDGTVMCVSTNNYIYRFNDFDKSWIQIINTGSTAPSQALWIAVANASHIYAAGVDNLLWYYVGEGTWVQVKAENYVPGSLTQVSVGDNDTLLMIALYGFVYR